jgi:hypothetical protein
MELESSSRCAGISDHVGLETLITMRRNTQRDGESKELCDPMRAQSAIDRLTGNAYDLVMEGESYRQRIKPRLSAQPTCSRPRSRNTDSSVNASTG